MLWPRGVQCQGLSFKISETCSHFNFNMCDPVRYDPACSTRSNVMRDRRAAEDSWFGFPGQSRKTIVNSGTLRADIFDLIETS